MDLKELPVQNGNGGRAGGRSGQKVLYCDPCKESFSLPNTGKFEPAEEACPECDMQVVIQKQGDGYEGRDKKICPNCMNNRVESSVTGESLVQDATPTSPTTPFLLTCQPRLPSLLSLQVPALPRGLD